MFRENTPDPQLSFFNLQVVLTPKLLSLLENSWAHTFRYQLFLRIPEQIFSVLYSDIESRPNTPINILVGAEIIKAGRGLTDERLMEAIQFDMQTRYALGIDDLSTPVLDIRTIYNFRRRIRVYNEETGINLIGECFKVITDEQLAEFEVNVGWQRMDSTQILSNLARLNRLELCLATLQQGVKGLPEALRTKWQAEHEAYLGKTPQNISYRLQKKDVEEHLHRVGDLLVQLADDLLTHGGEADKLALVQRLLTEQFRLEDDQPIALKPTSELTGGQLQSPHDPEATYRHKNDEGHVGYVANITETCDPENDLQLITHVEVVPNNTDDGQLLAAAIADLQEREVEVKRISTDGGYNGPTSAEACGETIEHCPQTIRGGSSPADTFGWEMYLTTFDEEGNPLEMSCPGGQTSELNPGQADNWSFAEFDRAQCAGCPFFEKECRVVPRVTMPPVIRVQLRSLQVARLRLNIPPNNYGIRANAESSVHAFKNPLEGSKLSTRGLFRAQMFGYGSALMVNLRRVHAFLHKEIDKVVNETGQNEQVEQNDLLLSVYMALVALWASFEGREGACHKPQYLFA